jgi:multiple antibiotic resistance protein
MEFDIRGNNHIRNSCHVFDIVGSIPIIVDLEQTGTLNLKSIYCAAVIMIVFLFFAGEELLKLIGIDVNSFAVAGSLSYSFFGDDFRNQDLS